MAADLSKSLVHILEQQNLGQDLGIDPPGARFRRPVVTLAAASTTLTADQSGSLVLHATAAGQIAVLPDAEAGLWFEFFVTVSNTSLAHKISCAAGDFFLGALVNVDTDTSNAAAIWTADGTTHDHISSNGTTTGGLLGQRIRVTAATTTLWIVEGVVHGSGIVATPFATS